MEFKSGDKIRLLNENQEGIFVRLMDKKTALIEIDGMDIPFPLNQIVHVKDIPGHVPDHIIKQEFKKKTAAPLKTSSAKKTNEIWEIDLHIHELLDTFKHMSNGEILLFQLRHLETMLAKAMAKKIRKVVVIHGVGEGVLKGEIIKLMGDYSNITCIEASYKKYGFGATELSIRY